MPAVEGAHAAIISAAVYLLWRGSSACTCSALHGTVHIAVASAVACLVELNAQAADVYAFGVLCWEMYTGQRAWSGMHCTQIVIAVTIRQRRLLLPPGAAAAFRDLVQQCMSDHPADRPNFQVRLCLWRAHTISCFWLLNESLS